MFVTAKDFKITVPALLFDAGFYVFDFAAKNELTKFLVVDPGMLERSPFIDIRFEPLAQAQFWVDTRALFSLEDRHDVARPRPVFIFHHAFVCSTLLARCLNQIDAFFSLKEPWILRRMADFKRAQVGETAGPEWREMFVKYVKLLCRNFPTGRVPVIKATNVANNLLSDVMHFMPGQQILYLYSDLEQFLISNLKKSTDTQQKMPALAQSFLRDGDFARRYPRLGDPSGLSLLQVCGLIWLVSLYNFRQAVDRNPNAAVRTLDAQELLDDLPSRLASLSRFFGHSPVPSEIRLMTDPGVTRTNAKDQSKPYGAEQKRLETLQIRSKYGGDLEKAMAWIAPMAEELQVTGFLQSLRLTG